MTTRHMDCEVIVTKTGTHAVRDRVTGEVMHPMGPATEAQNVYLGPSRLEARLREGQESDPPLVLFDVGLGAASNAIAAWKMSESLPPSARTLRIVSFEHDLGALALALDETHRVAFGLSAPETLVAARALLERGHVETARTRWTLRFGDFATQLAQADALADVVFWDMFSAGVNPGLWTEATFRALFDRCTEGATVHTYSAATSARSALLLAGFAVGVGGPTGERAQTTIAAVNVRALERPLDARWLERLARSSAPFPADVAGDAAAQLDARARIAAHPQFRAASRDSR